MHTGCRAREYFDSRGSRQLSAIRISYPLSKIFVKKREKEVVSSVHCHGIESHWFIWTCQCIGIRQLRRATVRTVPRPCALALYRKTQPDQARPLYYPSIPTPVQFTEPTRDTRHSTKGISAWQRSEGKVTTTSRYRGQSNEHIGGIPRRCIGTTVGVHAGFGEHEGEVRVVGGENDDQRTTHDTT